MKRVRDSKFELLRIVSMIFIVISHYSLWGDGRKPIDINI